MFKSVFAKIGIGGAHIDTRFHTSTVLPGGVLQGTAFVEGGNILQQIEDIYLYFKANVRHEDKYVEMDFYSAKIATAFTVSPGEKLEIPFSISLPYELPITMIDGQPINMRSRLYVVTDMNINDAIDASDEDVFYVVPSPPIEAVLKALYQLKFTFFKVDLERGKLKGAKMPFFQEFEYTARETAYAKKCKEIEVSFIAKENEVEVVLEIDKRGFFSGGDVYRRFSVPNQGFNEADIIAQIDYMMKQL